VKELTVWHGILLKAANANSGKKVVITELRSRGIPDFPAVLAYETAIKQPGWLSVEPSLIDFGVLKIGESSTLSLTVRGQMLKALSSNGRLSLKWITAADGGIRVNVTVSGGLAGEALQDEITLIGENNYQLKVGVLARWAPSISQPGSEPKWCPRCVPEINWKSLKLVQILNKYRCDVCGRTFALDDPTVTNHNRPSVLPPVSFTVEPRSIDFGILKTRETSTRTLRVRGKIIRAIASSKRLDLNWTSSDDGSILISVTVSSGSPGESLVDSILLVGNPGEVKVNVVAQWYDGSKKTKPPIQSGSFLLLWCPRCKPNIKWKSLLQVEGLNRYRCSNCGHTFSLDDDKVIDANH
jgi:transposase-like protein